MQICTLTWWQTLQSVTYKIKNMAKVSLVPTNPSTGRHHILSSSLPSLLCLYICPVWVCTPCTWHMHPFFLILPSSLWKLTRVCPRVRPYLQYKYTGTCLLSCLYSQQKFPFTCFREHLCMCFHKHTCLYFCVYICPCMCLREHPCTYLCTNL